jgi:hypothetical protein
MASVWDDCIEALVAALQAQTFAATTDSPESIPPAGGGNRVFKEWAENLKVVTFPCWIVLPDKARRKTEPAATGLKDVSYPCLALLCARESGDNARPMPKYLSWVEQVEARIAWRRLPGVPSVWQVRPEPLPAVDLRLPSMVLNVSGLVLWCVSREPITPP